MNLPNLITCSRVLLLGLIAWLMLSPGPGTATLACLLAIVASVSDWLDGWLARRYNQISNFGKLMDALIDKVFVLGVFILLVILSYLPLWTVAILILVVARDILITVLRAMAARRGAVLAADRWGKRKTIWQVTSICVLLFVPVVEVDLAQLFGVPLTLLAEFVWWNGLFYFLLSSGFALYSGVLYVIQYVPTLRDTGEAGE